MKKKMSAWTSNCVRGQEKRRRTDVVCVLTRETDGNVPAKTGWTGTWEDAYRQNGSTRNGLRAAAAHRVCVGEAQPYEPLKQRTVVNTRVTDANKMAH